MPAFAIEQNRSPAAALMVLALAACASTPPPAPDPPPAGALSEAERMAATNAVLAAVASGEPTRWESGRPGFYGYAEPGAASADGDSQCRAFSQTVFVDGRPRRLEGRACRPPGGVWRILAGAA